MTTHDKFNRIDAEQALDVLKDVVNYGITLSKDDKAILRYAAGSLFWEGQGYASTKKFEDAVSRTQKIIDQIKQNRHSDRTSPDNRWRQIRGTW